MIQVMPTFHEKYNTSEERKNYGRNIQFLPEPFFRAKKKKYQNNILKKIMQTIHRLQSYL